MPLAPFAVTAPPPPPRRKSPLSKPPAIATSPITTCTPLPPTRCPIHRPVFLPLLRFTQILEKFSSPISSVPTSTIAPHPTNATSSQNLQWSAVPPTRTHTSSTPGAAPTAITQTAPTPPSSGQPQMKQNKVVQISGSPAGQKCKLFYIRILHIY